MSIKDQKGMIFSGEDDNTSETNILASNLPEQKPTVAL